MVRIPEHSSQCSLKTTRPLHPTLRKFVDSRAKRAHRNVEPTFRGTCQRALVAQLVRASTEQINWILTMFTTANPVFKSYTNIDIDYHSDFVEPIAIWRLNLGRDVQEMGDHFRLPCSNVCLFSPAQSSPMCLWIQRLSDLFSLPQISEMLIFNYKIPIHHAKFSVCVSFWPTCSSNVFIASSSYSVSPAPSQPTPNDDAATATVQASESNTVSILLLVTSIPCLNQGNLKGLLCFPATFNPTIRNERWAFCYSVA